MSNKSFREDAVIWQHLVESYESYSLSLAEFLTDRVNRVALLRVALRSKDRTTAIHVLRFLRPSEAIQLFDEMMFLASFSHGAIQTVRDAILALPRDWVLSNIEKTAEPLLLTGTYDEYRRLLELIMQLDRDLAHKLAERAAQHADPDIREAGEDFVKRIESES